MRDNSIIRIQAEQNLAMKEEKKTKSNSKISKFGRELGPISRSRFPINDYDERIWQSHLERISDFLLVGEDRWWHREGNIAVFHGDEDPGMLLDGPTLMDFTIHTFQSSRKEVRQRWEACLTEMVSLPVRNIVVYRADGHFLKKLKGHRS